MERSIANSVRTSIEVDLVVDAAGVALGLHDEEQAFEMPGRMFEQLPFRTMGPVA
jgi:hypothetical protein